MSGEGALGWQAARKARLIALNAKIKELEQANAALRAERNAYRAVLEGAGYQMLDKMVDCGPEFSRKVGLAAANLVIGIKHERDQLKSEIEVLLAEGAAE